MNAPLRSSRPDPLLAHLGGYPAHIGKRARAAIACVLKGRESPGGSRLTGDGYPLELSFATRSTEARWTADPWHPAASRTPGESALRACARLGLEKGIAERFVEAGFGTSFAWIGGRHGDAGDRFKLYLSCPETDALPLLDTLVGRTCPAPGLDAAMPMLALYPQSGEFETYWRASPLPGQLPALLAAPGEAAWRIDLVRAIEDLWGHRMRDRPPGGRVFVSFRRRDEETLVTLYLFARALWGVDARCRRRWLARSDLDPGQRRAYAFATKGLAERRSPLTRHSMIGLHLGPGGIDFSIGVRPERSA